VATFLIGCLPTYAQIGVAAPIMLIVLRLLQGVAIGGEWGGAVLMSVEYAPPGRRALFGSVPQMGLAFGLMLGTGAFAFGQAVLSDTAFASWGWRVAFWLSLILVVIGMVIRLKVMETPAFRTLEKTEEKATVPALELVRDGGARRNLLLGMGARWVEGVAFNAWAVFVIAYSTNTLGMREGPALIAVMCAAAVLLVLIPVWGAIADRWTARRTYALGVALSAIVPLVSFPLIQSTNSLWLGLGVLLALGIVYPIMYAPEASFFADMFHAKVRYSGISVVYQMSGIFASGLTPLVLTWLLDIRDGGISLIILYFLITGVISLVCTLAVRPAVVEDGAAAQQEPGLVPATDATR
jgi:MFS family permease